MFGSRGDGDAALRTIDAQIPDLVILDLMLPRRDGYDVCRVIRQDERCQAVKIMMLTARGRELDRRKGLELGADEYVTKPFSNRDIVARVRRLLDGGPAEAGESGEAGDGT